MIKIPVGNFESSNLSEVMIMATLNSALHLIDEATYYKIDQLNRWNKHNVGFSSIHR